MNIVRSFFLHKICLIAFTHPFLLSESLVAKDSNDSATHSTHLHGYAELTIALDGDLLEINLESPAFNIIGFEYKAKSAKEIQRLEKSEELLKAAERIFSFKGTHCDLKNSEASIENSADPNKASRGTEHEGHAERHDQEEHHEHRKHEEHHEYWGHEEHEEHEEHHDREKQHSEISSNYVYECDAGENLTAIDVKLISHFPAIEKLKVMWVTNERQGALDLTESAETVLIRQ